MIIAGICILLAAAFLLRGDLPTAFVIATVGVVAWFLNYRLQMREITVASDSKEHENKERDDLDQS